MKKSKLFVLFGIIFVLLFVAILGCAKKETKVNTDTIKLAEVTHSMFYAPLYVAIEEGYFKEEGINLELILTSGADKVSAAVLSDDVQIGFAGPESAIYVYENGEKDYLVTFAGLTKRDGQFIVARNKNDNFDVTDLYDKEILVGRKGGMPALNFRNGMKLSKADIEKIKINESIDFASLTGVFLSGVGVTFFSHIFLVSLYISSSLHVIVSFSGLTHIPVSFLSYPSGHKHILSSSDSVSPSGQLPSS